MRPDPVWRLSKAFGEALAAFYAHKHGLRTTSIRIGNVSDIPADKRRLSIWLKPEDLVQLVRIGLSIRISSARILRRVRQCARLLGQCASLSFAIGRRAAPRITATKRSRPMPPFRPIRSAVVPGRTLLQR